MIEVQNPTSKQVRGKVNNLSSSISRKLILNTKNPNETRKLGRILGELLQGGDVVALYGYLGSGKTCLIQGIARGTGVKEKYITSPTFIMINEYNGRIPFYHIDLFRLNPSDIESLGLRDYISFEGATVIEWSERAGDDLPEERLSIHIKITGKESREIRVKGEGERYINLVNTFAERIGK
ncbi:MAG: tRNA (adenosine(37)-N6)-threonylcarbamoyltransferase complex ATPase subunit type 1 TsaE [Nitrospirae bacterium]|nr:tRNA (adenosine(37)-N6)-threonylcarbamoyltransferase complex ATPase subunit type 1 TsaE [Nitrospirota bacterium]